MYIPKSQIKTNLYTNGDPSIGEAYVLSTDKSLYVGYYYELSNGQKFTGKYPGDNVNITLEPITYAEYLEDNSSIYYNVGISDYNVLKNISDSKPTYLPQYLPTIPTNKDYQTGEYTRYFCKKINELLYVEISKDYYTKLTKQNTSVAFEYYLPFNIPWRLAGKVIDVYNTNKNIVALTMKKQKLSMFNKYLKEDYTKYYK